MCTSALMFENTWQKTPNADMICAVFVPPSICPSLHLPLPPCVPPSLPPFLPPFVVFGHVYLTLYRNDCHTQEKAAIWKRPFAVPPTLHSPSSDNDNASALESGEDDCREGGGGGGGGGGGERGGGGAGGGGREPPLEGEDAEGKCEGGVPVSVDSPLK